MPIVIGPLDSADNHDDDDKVSQTNGIPVNYLLLFAYFIADPNVIDDPDAAVDDDDDDDDDDDNDDDSDDCQLI